MAMTMASCRGRYAHAGRTMFTVRHAGPDPASRIFVRAVARQHVPEARRDRNVSPEKVKALSPNYGISESNLDDFLKAILGLKDEKHFRTAYQQPAIAAGLIEMTVPDKPHSRLQKYRITPKGLALLKEKSL